MKTGAVFDTSSPWPFFHARKAFRCVLSSWGMKIPLLSSLALADYQRTLAVSQEAVTDLQAGDLGSR